MAGRAVIRAWQRHVAGQDDPRLAASYAAGVGFAVTLAVAAIVGHLRAQLSLTLDLGIFAAVVALSGWWMTWLGAVATAALAFPMLNGFAVDRYGVLRWHGGADAVRLVVLLGCAGVVSAVRELHLRRRRRTASERLTREPAGITGTTALTREG